MSTPVLIAALGVGFTSCAKAPPDTEEPPAVGRKVTNWQRVSIFLRRLPQCDFVQLRSVTGSSASDLQQAAFAAGGDAVIVETSEGPAAGGQWAMSGKIKKSEVELLPPAL